MTTPIAPAPTGSSLPGPPSGSPTLSPSPDPAGASGRGGQPLISSVRWLKGSRLILGCLTVAFAAVSVFAGIVSRNATSDIRQSLAPTLVGVQNLFASSAEADAAATAAYISAANGAENRAQRNLYEDALRRTTAQTEEVAALLAEDADESHAALQDVAFALTNYSGGIETARFAGATNQAEGNRLLVNSLTEKRSVFRSSIDRIADAGQLELNEASNAGRRLTLAGIGLGVLTLLALMFVQLQLFRRTNRVINLPLAVATLLIGATVVLMWRGAIVRSEAIDNSLEGGYESILAAAQIQRDAYSLQASNNLGLLGRGFESPAALTESLDAQIAVTVSLADSTRERAAAELLSERWERYQRTSDPTQQLGEFNGLNTSIESVILDNQEQFLSGVSSAAEAVEYMPFYALAAPLLALLAVIYGIQLRVREYL